MVKVVSGVFKKFLYNNKKKKEFILEKHAMYKLKTLKWWNTIKNMKEYSWILTEKMQ